MVGTTRPRPYAENPVCRRARNSEHRGARTYVETHIGGPYWRGDLWIERYDERAAGSGDTA